MLDHLRAHPPPTPPTQPQGQPQQPQPWGEINIVSHANEHGGMGIGLDAQHGQSINRDELQAAVDSGQIQSLPDTVVDHQTNVNVHGCALGRSPDMLATISQAFGGNDAERPTVYAPRDLQVYQVNTTRSGRTITRTYEEYLAEYWSIGFPEGERWNNARIVREFNSVHGAVAGIDWAGQVPGAHRSTDTYTYAYDWTRTIIPAQSDRRGHKVLLASAMPQSSSWTTWRVQSQTTTRNGNTDHTEIVYAFTQPDPSGSGTQSGSVTITLDNPHVPTTPADQLSLLTADLPVDAPRYTWTFTLSNPSGSPGQSVTAHMDCSGRRSVVRVQRALTEATGAHIDPSRTDTAHYNSDGPPPPASNPTGTSTPAQPPATGPTGTGPTSTGTAPPSP